MCAPSRKTVSGDDTAFVPTSPRPASSLLISSAMRPTRFRTVVFNWAEQGRNISINRAASRNECLDPNSGCRRRSSGVARSGKSPEHGDSGRVFSTPADWHEQCRVLGDFTRKRPNIVSKMRPRSSWIVRRRPQSLHFRRAGSASSICSCRIASCNHPSNCFASSRSRPRFAGPNSSGARRSRPILRLRVSPSSNVVSTKILTSILGPALF